MQRKSTRTRACHTVRALAVNPHVTAGYLLEAAHPLQQRSALPQAAARDRLMYHSEGCAARALLLVAHDQRRCHCHPLHGLAHGADIQVVDEEVAHLCGSLAWGAAVLREGGAAQCAMDDAGYIALPG